MWDELAAIHAASFICPAPWSAADLRASAEGAGGFLLAESQGFLIGRALAGEAELLTLATHPDARRQGVATRLVHDFLNTARNQAETAFLEVAATNFQAIRLYERHGFRSVGVRPRYYGSDDAIVMRCPL
ncbi:GNAT family N-acetyltransferase [Falsirhodobacter algicola]|uniref:GNAT family N-acetyltransferase n=1 Tax=Falsirhodobacter algicola TaxID=2692330 RepID=A0A8J8MQH4_9RHOB|nr:GNAT family N-acetyltransferase [Falsirhodobacter algicola]QUS34817.1 GNAT family N-acetyltransferase [Falsirhodobacter algicola]